MTENLVNQDNSSENINEETSVTGNQTVLTSSTYDNISRSEILSRMKEIISLPLETMKEEFEVLKQNYYRILKQEIELLKQQYIQVNMSLDGFVTSKDEYEETFRDLIEEFKTLKNKFNEEQEKTKQDNLDQKSELLSKMNLIVEDSENVEKHIKEFDELSKSFKEIRNISTQEVKAISNQYQAVLEKFYDLLKINRELRDYDFRKNLERKEQLCVEAEALTTESDIVAAFRKLQTLHDEWRDVGPVAKKDREEIWKRFKDASSIINKKHQDYFNSIKESESDNEIKKTEICEQIEALDLSTITTQKIWEEKTKYILELQEKWKQVGYASKKVNNLLFERFRKDCDNFFNAKAEYFTSLKDSFQENLKKKTELCEKAEALKDSSDWKKTSDDLVKIQKEWKSIGPVPRKYSDALWKRFISACDSFFERKNQELGSQKQTELNNLSKKRDLIAKLKELSEGDVIENGVKAVKQLSSEWNEIGFVPFKEKDKIYKEYQELLNTIYKKLNVNDNKRNIDNFASHIGGSKDNNSLYRERERLMRNFENMKTEIKNYENNLGFLSSSSKSGNALVKEMERKMDKLKEDMDVIIKKIDIIDERLSAK